MHNVFDNNKSSLPDSASYLSVHDYTDNTIWATFSPNYEASVLSHILNKNSYWLANFISLNLFTILRRDNIPIKITIRAFFYLQN